MPIIRPSSDLRNNYNEISTICHETNKPIYITKNGAGDLAVMSIELYETLTEKYNSAENVGGETIQKTQKQEHTKQEDKKEKIHTTREVNAKPKVEKEEKTDKVQNLQSQQTKTTEKQEVESAHEILQEVSTVQVIKPTFEKKTQPVNTEEKKSFTQFKPTENKHNINIGYKGKETGINYNYNKRNDTTTNTVIKKVDTGIKSNEKTQAEPAHEILQDIEIKPEKEYTTNNNVFRELNTTVKPVEKKQTQVAKGITGGTEINAKSLGGKNNYNNDWIFEDLNKMLNDIKI